jgi:sugar transferase (PEP-CTERM/EpsH1 system associated)
MKRDEPPLVAHVIHRLDFGGLENGVVNLVNHTPADRYRQAIVCLAGFNPVVRARIQRTDVTVISLDKRPGKDFGSYARMWRTLRRLRPSVVHTRNLGTVDMQWIAALAGIRRRVHGEHGWEATDPWGTAKRSLRIRRACRPVIHRYVPMSQDIASWLKRDVGVDPSRIHQVYNGVDTRKFAPALSQPPTDDAAGLVRDAGDGSGALVTIGTVGRLAPIKNQAALVRALRAIFDQRPDLVDRVRLVIVGDGPVRGELESLAAGLGLSPHVQFTGESSDTAKLMRRFDIFVLPSVNEGISNTILEAMATGLPVVAADVGGNPELVRQGVTGSLYGRDDACGMVRALLRYLDDPKLRRAHGLAGRQRAVQNFSLDSMVEGYLHLYDELLTPSPATSGRGSG